MSGTGTGTAANCPWSARRYRARLLGTGRLALPLVTADADCGEKSIRHHTACTNTTGTPISCHDGGITRVGDTIYWYGTSYKGNPTGIWGRKAAHLQQGLNCYSSNNLTDWKHEGTCFQFPREG